MKFCMDRRCGLFKLRISYSIVSPQLRALLIIYSPFETNYSQNPVHSSALCEIFDILLIIFMCVAFSSPVVFSTILFLINETFNCSRASFGSYRYILNAINLTVLLACVLPARARLTVFRSAHHRLMPKRIILI